MAKVTWSNPAIEDLYRIQLYYADAAPAFGKKLVAQIVARAHQLEEFPEMGRLVPEFDDGFTRELITGSYRLIYRLRGGQPVVVEVARVHPSALPLTNLNESLG